MTSVCDAQRADLPGILAIYNEVIRTTTAVYAEAELSFEEGGRWFEDKLGGGFPFLVSRDASGVTGFATFGEFRTKPCFRLTVEHTVHVRADRRGRAVGAALLTELIGRARAMGKHVMIAGIDADNAGSIRLHERCGFRIVGHLHEVGFKFGRWLDLVFLELELS